MRSAFLSAVWLAASMLVASSETSEAEKSLRIGSSLSLTGKQYSLQGGYCREGYLLCQKHENAQGGVLGRSIEFVIYDDQSDESTAVRNYEKLITEDKVDAVLGPYGSAITEAVADLAEKHRMIMVVPTAGSTAIWEKGRRYLIMMLSPVESLPEGLLDLAVRNGLKRVAVIKLDGLVANAAAKGAGELAKKKGLEVVFLESYQTGTTDFSGILNKAKATMPDVLMAASVRLEDLVAINRQMKEVDLNVKMLSSVPYGLLPDYYTEARKRCRVRLQRLLLGDDAAILGQSGIRLGLREGIQPHSIRSVRGFVRGLQALRGHCSAHWQLGFRQAPRGAPQHQSEDCSWRFRGRRARIPDRTQGNYDLMAGRQASRCLAR